MKEYEVFIKIKNCDLNISMGTFNNMYEAQRELTKRKKTDGYIDGWIEEKSEPYYYNTDKQGD